MKYFLLICIVYFSFENITFNQTCCPQILKSSIKSGNCLLINGGTCGICSDASVTLSVEDGKNLPESSLISWYYSTTKGFNPSTGQGTLLGSTPIPSSSCDNAATVKFNEVMVRPSTFDDNFTNGPKGEWIEIIGPPGMSLACYIITDGDWAITIPPGYSIGSDGLFVVGTNAASGPEVDLDVNSCGCVFSPAAFPNNVLTLDNNGEYLLLFDGNSFVDAFRWGAASPLNTFPFGDLVTAGQIPTANVIGCVQSVPFSFPSWMGNNSKSAVNESYSRLPDYSGNWELSCPTIGKCNATASGIFPLNLDVVLNGLQCNQTIYVKALLTPNKPGCTAVLSPEYTLFVSCPVKDLKKTICINESISVNNNTYDVNNPSGQEVLTGQSYYGCDSIVNVDLSFYPEVSAIISDDVDICLGQTANLTVNFTGVPPFTFTYNINGFFGGTITTSSNPYKLQIKPNSSVTVELEDVFDKNNCTGLVSGTSNISVDAPKASLSGLDKTICAGDTFLIPITLSGYPDFSFIYTLNGKDQPEIKTDKGTYFLAVIPTDTTIIKIKQMIDDQGCLAAVSGIDSLFVRPAIQVNNLLEICNPGNTYDVSFIITGGDSASWTVTGPGILTDSFFISTGLPGGSTYTFIVKDGSKCSADTISNTVLCNCQNKIGVMDQATLHACADGSVTAKYDASSELLEPGDIRMYILHDNSGNSPGFIYSISSSPTFTIAPGMVPGNVYYISAIIGIELTPGTIDLTDECLRVALGTPVIFHDFPSINITGDQSICAGNCASINIDFFGEALFDINYIITDNSGVQNFTKSGLGNNYNFMYCSGANSASQIVNVNVSSLKDAYCDITINESYQIQVNTPAVNNLSKDLCTGQTLVVNGITYSESNPSGTESILGGSYLGCDSIINIDLNFVNTVVENYKPVICQNTGITINGQLFDQNNLNGSFSFPGGSVAGCDSILNVQLSFYPIDTGLLSKSLCQTDQITINGKIYDINNPFGVETLGGQSYKGCDSIVVVNLNFYPVVNSFINDTLCKNDILIVNGHQYDFNKPAGFEVIKNGSIHGCDSTIQLQLLFIDDITASISGPDSICPGEDVEIILHFSQIGTYNVAFDDGSGNTISLNNVNDGTTFTISNVSKDLIVSLLNVVNNEFNCPVINGPPLNVIIGSLNSQVVINTDYNGSPISCHGAKDGSIAVVSKNTTGPLTYNWSNGATTDSLNNLGAGNYTVTILDSNGCQAVNTIELKEPEIIVYNYLTVDGSCNGTGKGELHISSINGGIPGYTYTLNNQAPTPAVLPIIIADLDPGTYTLDFIDKNGCKASDAFNINQSNSSNLFLDIGPDITIESGKQIGLSPDLNFIPKEINWVPATGLNCSTCIDPVFKYDSTITYILNIKDENGCEVKDEITINVLSKNVLFVPNVFSPNGDGINDRLNIFTSDKVVAIKRFAIFDRWGENLYDVSDLPLNSTDYGWDGKQRGSKANQGVYVYYLLVTLQDGTDKVFKGDITLNR